MQTHIAVLMPVYNPGSEIKETLDSLKNQTLPFKLFVVDDGSTRKPDYQNLLSGLNHELITLPKNVGVNEVRNHAISRILQQGFKYTALIDCGDIAKPQRLERQYSTMERRPEIDILGSAVQQVFKITGVEFTLRFPEETEAVKRLIWSNIPVCHPSLMIRSNVFEKIGVYSKTYSYAEDYELMFRATKARLFIANLPDVLLEKIETSDSVSHKQRSLQLQSRLKIQWQYRNLLNPFSTLGLMRTLVLSRMPTNFLNSLKKYLSKKTNSAA